MADQTTPIPQVSQSVSQRETQINNNFDAASPSMIFGRRASACAGLVFGYIGGRFNGEEVANGTVTATDDDDNYVVVDRSTLAVSISTSDTNWNNTTDYGRMYLLTAADGAITDYEDHRASNDGTGILSPLGVDVFDGDAGAGGTIGLVPAPDAGDAAAGKFLKADGTWDTPSGGPGGGGSSIWAALVFGA